MANVIERSVLLAKQGGIIEPAHLPPEIVSQETAGKGLLSLEAIERQHIARVLKVVKDLDEAARVLEIDPATLWRKRKKYGISD